MRLFHLSIVAIALWQMAMPLHAAEPTTYLLDDTNFVLRVEVRQIVMSPAVRPAIDKQAQKLLQFDEVQKALQFTGLDLFKDVDRVLVIAGRSSHRTITRGSNVTSGGNPLLVVQGRFDREKFLARADQLAKDMPDKIKVEKIGDGKLYDITEFLGGTMFVALTDANTLVASIWKDQIEDALAKGAGTKKTQLKDKAMQALVMKMDSKHAVAWAAGGDMVRSTSYSFAGNGLVVEHTFLKDCGVDGIVGGLSIDKDVSGQATVVAKDANAAKMLVTALEATRTKLQKAVEKHKDLAPALEAARAIQIAVKNNTLSLEGQTSGAAFAGAIRAVVEWESPDKN